MELQFFISSAASNVQELGDYEQIVTLAAAVPLSLPPRHVNYVMVQAEGQNVRYRDDGIKPTATMGMILYAGAAPTKFAGSIKLMQFIAATAGAILNVRYY